MGRCKRRCKAGQLFVILSKEQGDASEESRRRTAYKNQFANRRGVTEEGKCGTEGFRRCFRITFDCCLADK